MLFAIYMETLRLSHRLGYLKDVLRQRTNISHAWEMYLCDKLWEVHTAGGRLQTHCFADGDYTFVFCFCRNPVDNCWLKKSLTPSGHKCNMDNVYSSVQFACEAYSLEVEQTKDEPYKNYMKTLDIVRASSKGITDLVKQSCATTL